MDTLSRLAKIERLAVLIEADTIERFKREGYTPELHYQQAIKTNVKPGTKYTKVDVGSSGKYMIDTEGNIFGIKAYGVIHRGHQYGTLDTISEWNWGGYTATRKQVQAV